MINSPKEADISTKAKASASSTSSSSSQWLKLKDPRIVRVSRAFGGKDRHSKVYTIKGLRDRRVRLSVPTAIHLYDLQERLGLNQPSKVVDWLLNVAKHEIDDLPPLPIPPNNFTLGYPSFVSSNHKEAPVDAAPTKWSLGRVDVRGLIPTSTENVSSFGSGNDSIQNNNTSICKSKSKQVLNLEEMVSEKEYWMNRSEDLEEDKQGSNNAQHVLPNNLLLRANHPPSFLGLLNTMPLGYQLEPSVDVAAKLGFVNQVVTDHVNGINHDVPFPSSLSLSTGSTTTTTPQFLVCPHAGATQPYFLSHVAAMEMDPRQINNYQMMSSNTLNNSLNPSQHLMMRNYQYANFASHDYKNTGKGSLKLQLINQRYDFSFGLFTGNLTNPKLLAMSNKVSFINPKAPVYPRLAQGKTWDEELYGIGARRIGILSMPVIGCLPSQRITKGGMERGCSDLENQAAHLLCC